MRVNDFISGAAFLALAVFLAFEAESFVSMPGVPYGPKVFPQIICFIMGGAGLALMVSGLRRLSVTGWAQLDDWARNPSSILVLATIAIGFSFYIFFSETLGYLMTSVVMLGLVMSVTRGLRRWLSNIAISIVASGVIYFAFSQLLRVPLPIGPLERALLGYS